jgi:Glycosyl transferase 4-like domain
VRGLAAEGFRMEILSFEKPEDLLRTDAVAALAEELSGLGIGWQRLSYHRRPTLPATGWDVIRGRRRIRAWMRARRGAGPGLVHARAYVSGLMGLVASGDPDHRLLFDMRGFWVDERIGGGYWSEGGPQARVGRWMERSILRGADRLVVLTRRSTLRLGELAGGVEPPPYTIVPTCVDLDRFVPGDPREARRALGLPDRPTLVHIGTLSGWYDGRLTMEVGRAFVQRTGGTFLILTRDRSHAQRLTESFDCPAHIRTVPAEEMPRWLRAADAGISLLTPSPAEEARYPTKVGEYLASGLAVLATPIGDLPELEDPELFRLMPPEGDPNAAAAWLETAAASATRAAGARRIAERHLGLPEGVRRLAELYRSLGIVPR